MSLTTSGSRSAEPPAQYFGRVEGGRDWPKPGEHGRIVGSNRAAAMHRFERAHGLAVSLVSLVRRSRFVPSGFSIIANRDGQRFFKNTCATATYYRYRCNLIIVFDWRYDVRKNVRTFSISTSGDSMNSLPAWHLNVIVDARALSIADTRFDCRLWQVPIMLVRHSELCAIFWYKRCLCSSLNHLGGRDRGKKRMEYGRCDVCANWQLTFTRVHACAAWLSTIWSFRGYTKHAVICGTRNFLEEKKL